MQRGVSRMPALVYQVLRSVLAGIDLDQLLVGSSMGFSNVRARPTLSSRKFICAAHSPLAVKMTVIHHNLLR